MQPIQRACRNASIISWLNTVNHSMVTPLPGCRNTLRDMQLGYASYLGGIPVDEVDPLWFDPGYLDWIYVRYSKVIHQWEDEML